MNPIQLIVKTYQNLVQCIQTHVSHLLADSHPPSSSSDSLSNHHRLLFSFYSSPSSTTSSGDQSLIELPQEKNLFKFAKPVSKEELGRATWTFLHTLTALCKLVFPCQPCQRVDARWGKFECRERACDLEESSIEYRNR
ncbi:hypothetical protein IFM89_038953 [Coptis chinensis]|uniref:Uncharacterized protein n=1 Tax=Coptis chinensis TaxID=261450 RepID=A0A835IX13_9MAGN|nr:hypothetical protein IFM89_038953 [Coptis chinensis]